MPIKDILRNVNLFVDGRGFAGRVDELELPKLTIQTRSSGPEAWTRPWSSTWAWRSSKPR